MTCDNAENPSGRQLNPLAKKIMSSLAAQFPVCMASDEFHFFPQAMVDGDSRSHWDDFSPDAMTTLLDRLKKWQQALVPFLCLSASIHQRAEASMLHRVLQSLSEQFEFVKVQKTQPSFYLTIVGIGLAEAVDTGGRVWTRRLRELPEFIDQARQNLTELPRLFRDIGLEMLSEQRSWLHSLNLTEKRRDPIFNALDRLNTHLKNIQVHENFLPDVDLYERIACEHIGCKLSPDQIARELHMETVETRSILEQGAKKYSRHESWQNVIDTFPVPAIPKEGITELYRNTISQLSKHCKEQRLVDGKQVWHCPVTVEPIPNYMRPVRSNAAYSMPPRHPPVGGTFFIQETDEAPMIPTDYQLLTAHETFPGHHLLDTCRWQQARVIRRHIEFPLFYEGWASFAEELMFETGFFCGQKNRMLMAKRRFWRAIRGQIDFDIHMRRKTLDEATALLISTGMPKKRAGAMVRRYCLKPGYQLSYTIGRRRFRQLYDTWSLANQTPALFARQVLALGEIEFHHLEQQLRQGG